jgi:hypothetical protein
MFLCTSLLVAPLAPSQEPNHPGLDETRFSGFLDDYSLLEPHPDKEMEGTLLYVRPGLDLSNYDKVYIHHPLIFLSESGETRGINPKELWELSEYFYDKLVDAIGDDYELTFQPGPGVLVVRSSISDVLPVKAKNTTKTALALEVVNLDLSGASIEADFLDGANGDTLAALVDSRKGKRFDRDSKTWTQSKDAFKFRASQLPQVLDGEHGSVQKRR